MLKRLDAVDMVAALMIGLVVFGILAGAFFSRPDPVLRQVHPKPGITCFIYSGYGISCLKD